MLVLILLLQVSAPSDPDLEVEVLEPLKSSIEYQLGIRHFERRVAHGAKSMAHG